MLLKAAQSESLPAAKPELLESTLEVLYSLAAAPESGFPMQHLLRQVCPNLEGKHPIHPSQMPAQMWDGRLLQRFLAPLVLEYLRICCMCDD